MSELWTWRIQRAKRDTALPTGGRENAKIPTGVKIHAHARNRLRHFRAKFASFGSLHVNSGIYEPTTLTEHSEAAKPVLIYRLTNLPGAEGRIWSFRYLGFWFCCDV